MKFLGWLLAPLAVLAVAGVALLLLLPVSSAGVGCGNVIAQHHHEAAPWFVDKGGLFYPLQNPADAAPVACDTAVGTRRTMAIIVGVIAAIAAAQLAFVWRRANKNKP